MRSECIVGIDGSDVAVDALRWAVRNRRADDHVIALIAWHLPLLVKATMARRSIDVDRLGLAAEAGHQLTKAIRALGEEGTGVDRLVVEGHASDVLTRYGESSSLVVVGRRGASNLKQVVVGSTSRHCATHAVGPTVVVPPGFDRPRAGDIVVGFDGSDHACAALRWAISFFDAAATIRTVAAVDVSPWLDPELTLGRFPDDVREEEQRLAAAFADADPDGRSTLDVVLHSPKQALATVAGVTDVIVVGTRGRGAIGAAMLGSVSTWLLHNAVCPVAVVPPQSTA